MLQRLFSVRSPIYTFPSVRVDNASSPALISVSLSLRMKLKSGANGAESNPVTNMSRGVLSGMGMMS